MPGQMGEGQARLHHRFFVVIHYMNVNRRYIADAGHFVRVKIFLYRFSIFKVRFMRNGRTQRHYYTSFNLRFNNIRVYVPAAIQRLPSFARSGSSHIAAPVPLSMPAARHGYCFPKALRSWLFFGWRQMQPG